MANTCYKDCWWLTQAISGEFGSGSYRKGDGYSLEELEDFYSSEFHTYYDMTDSKEKKTFSVKIWRLRIRLYYQFGLIIYCGSDPGVIAGKGYGGYFYYLGNPDILSDPGQTLREHIELLAKYEKNIPTELPWTDQPRRCSGNTSSLGFIPASGVTPRVILGEDNMEFVQFAMQFGEVLTIKFGKVRNGIDINAPYSFEPYQLKEIEGRWYVIGNLYPLGHKEQSELAIYDLARLQFSDEENQDILYVPVNGFDINEHILLDAACKRRMGGVRPIDIITHTEEFADYLRSHPLCSAQEEIADGTFRIYIKLTNELIVQLGAYGNEISIGMISKDGDEEHDRYVIRKALNYFRKSEE